MNYITPNGGLLQKYDLNLGCSFVSFALAGNIVFAAFHELANWLVEAFPKDC